MPISTFTSNQRKAIELLGYKRWLLRDEVSHLQESMIHDTHTCDEKRTSISTNHIPSKSTFSSLSNTTVKTAVETEESLHTSTHPSKEYTEQKEPNKDNHFRMSDIDLYITPQMTVFKWQSTQYSKTMVLALPPLWGTNNELSLFQEQAECKLLINAMRSCGLAEIAEKLAQVNTFIDEHSATITLNNSITTTLNTTQLIDANTIVMIVNTTLPALQVLKESLQTCEQASLITLTHPYFCLQQPMKKAELWHQLIHLQVKIL